MTSYAGPACWCFSEGVEVDPYNIFDPNIYPSNLKALHSLLSPRPSTLDPKPKTLNPHFYIHSYTLLRPKGTLKPQALRWSPYSLMRALRASKSTHDRQCRDSHNNLEIRSQNQYGELCKDSAGVLRSLYTGFPSRKPQTRPPNTIILFKRNP